jgi:hypothetical protein
LKNLTFLFFLTLLILSGLNGFSQTYKVRGQVADTSKIAISDATVVLVQGKDTLKTRTNTGGEFTFNKLGNGNFSVTVSVVGYQNFKQSYSFDKKKRLDIDDIQLKLASNMLREVVIKTKPNPIRVMQDTVEYDAAAYQVLEGDNVADLIKQFSGVEVDDDYNVKSMGENVVKLRVNGKDFFTNDVKKFIATLPAAIVSKIQLIDDYGDEANFTGLKIGEPQKLINIVTKPGMDRGKFGNMNVTAGSNSQIGTNNVVNLWNGDKQTGLDLGFTTQDNGAGNSQNTRLSVDHRNKVGKTGNISFSYGLNQNNNAFTNEQAIETVSDLGTYYNLSQSDGKSKSGSHNLSSNFRSSSKKLFINGNISASYSNNGNNSLALNSQSGVTRQDFKNLSETTGRSPSISGSFNLSKKMKDNRNSLSANVGFSVSDQRSSQLISTNTLYYNQQDLTLLKDSVLTRSIENKNTSNGFSLGGNYTKAINKLADTTGKKTISVRYFLSVTNSFDQSSTSVLSSFTNSYEFVDSLSSALSSIFINQSLGISYNYNNKKSRFSAGINARPTILMNDYINLNEKITNKNFNYSPTLNYNRTIKKGQTLSLGYSGNNNSPSPSQLQPIRNTQNLQNIVIGNPNLKPSFRHSLNSNYRYLQTKSGVAVFVSANFSTTQNEIVNNVIVLPDTLGSYKQETRYENTNGTYNLSGNYDVNVPLKNKKLILRYNGTIGVSNKALFINNNRYFNSGLNFSQRISGDLNLKKMSFNLGVGYNQVNNNNVQALQSGFIGITTSTDPIITGSDVISNFPPAFNPGQLATTSFFTTKTFTANFNGRLKLQKLSLSGAARYSYSSNTNEALPSGNRDLQTLALTLKGYATVKKSYRVSFDISKRINSGYAIANQNPLLIGVNFSKLLLKDKSLSLNAGVSDLLNQGNMISRRVSGNSVIDSRNNVITRVFSIGLSYNLSSFGANGTVFRVDPD